MRWWHYRSMWPVLVWLAYVAFLIFLAIKVDR